MGVYKGQESAGSLNPTRLLCRSRIFITCWGLAVPHINVILAWLLRSQHPRSEKRPLHPIVDGHTVLEGHLHQLSLKIHPL